MSNSQQKPVYNPGVPAAAKAGPTTFTAPKKKRSVGRIFAWILLVFGLILFISVIDGKQSNGEPINDPIGTLFFSLAMVAGGGYWIWSITKRQKKGVREQVERAILTIAERNGGVIDAATLCRETWMTSEEARQQLEELSGRGIGHADFDENGRTFFRF